MADPTYPLFSIFAFLGFFVTLVPLPWHFQAWNSGTCYYMIWASLSCLNQFVNSIVWANNALNPAPIWCDISTRIMLGASVGLPAASLCINRRLYHIASVQVATITRAEKRRIVVIDSLICVLYPLIFVALSYIVQGHRFNIFEEIGCYPATYNTLLTYLLVSMWPIVIGLISSVYCVLSIRHFLRRRAQFNQLLSSNKSLSISRYFRLMALSMTEMSLTTPLTAFVIWLNATAEPVGPWRSFADTHFAFSRVEQFPSVIWREDHLLVVSIELTRWATPACAFIFFVFFGFASEARRHYRNIFWTIVKPFGFEPVAIHYNQGSTDQYRKPVPPTMSPHVSDNHLPVYSHPPSKVRLPKRPVSLTSLTVFDDEKISDETSTRPDSSDSNSTSFDSDRIFNVRIA